MLTIAASARILRADYGVMQLDGACATAHARDRRHAAGAAAGMRAVVTGGAGYIGSMVVGRLLAAGHEVVVLDLLQHGQRAVAADLERRGARIVEGDVRDAAARATALEGADALVHLAAIVGDPACAQDPELSRAVNVDASRALFAEAAGVPRIVFASTCSNYGRMADPIVALDESAPLAPVSLYASQKVEIETRVARGRRCDLPALRHRLRRQPAHALRPHCQRVHSRPVGGPRARGLRRPVLAPLRARRRCGAGDRARAGGSRTSKSAAACSTSATRARTTASRTSSR